MPDKQFYLISVAKMCTSDDADLVAKWSAVIAEDDLSKLTLPTAAEAAGLALKGCPIDGIRPMTEDEIREWRENADQ